MNLTDLKIKVEQQKADIDFYKERSSKYEAQVAVLLEQTHRQKAEIEKFEKIDHFAQKTIDLQTAEIKKLEAEIAQKDIEINILVKKKETLRDEIAELSARNDELNALNKTASIEAIKEFSERLKQGRASDLIVKHIDTIDKIVREMVGE